MEEIRYVNPWSEEFGGSDGDDRIDPKELQVMGQKIGLTIPEMTAEVVADLHTTKSRKRPSSKAEQAYTVIGGQVLRID